MSPTEAMIQQILERSAHAGRDKLGQLAYQMARTCLSKAEFDAADAIRWIVEPRRIADLSGDMRSIEARTETELDRSELPLVDPSSGSAIESARACLDVLRKVEGESNRSRLLQAYLVQSDGDLADAERVFASVLELPCSVSWLADVQENRQAMLLRLDRFNDVIDLGESLLHRSPGRLATHFNMATAKASLRDESGFDLCCERFRVSAEKESDHEFWERTIDREAVWFAEQVNRDPSDIRSAFQRDSWNGDGS